MTPACTGGGAGSGSKKKTDKVQKVAEKVREALVQSQVTFNRVPEKLLVKDWAALVQSPVRFNKVPGKVLEKVWAWEALVQERLQVEQGSGEGSGEGSREGVGGFGVEPGQVQQGSGQGSGEGLGGVGAEPGVSSAWFRSTLHKNVHK